MCGKMNHMTCVWVALGGAFVFFFEVVPKGEDRYMVRKRNNHGTVVINVLNRALIIIIQHL